MPNPVNVEFFVPATSATEKKRLKGRFGAGKRSIAYMGRISYEKDIDQTIRAFGIASRDLPDTTLMIVGDGPERKRLEALAKELGVDGKTIFTGMLHREDLRDALQANDIFVTASRSENMPVSVVEAMACGLPVAFRERERHPRNRDPRQERPACRAQPPENSSRKRSSGFFRRRPTSPEKRCLAETRGTIFKKKYRRSHDRVIRKDYRGKNKIIPKK